MSEERKKHISVLKNMLDWMKVASRVFPNEERKEAVKYAIASLETDEAYQLEYERTTKNDLGVELIDRAELLKAMDTWDKFGYTAQYGLERLDRDDKGFVPYVKYEDMVNCVKGMSSVTPQEPRKGHWISHREHCKMNNLLPSGLGSYFWCSECDCGIDSKNFSRVKHNFCPNCGADMREVEE